MKEIIIKDLELNQELDKRAMEGICGGAIILDQKSKDKLVGIVLKDDKLMKQIDEIWIKVEEYVKQTRYDVFLGF